MNVHEALNLIHAPKGATSVIAGLLGGDSASIQDQDATGIALAEATEKLKTAKRNQNDARSDAAWWGYAGDVAYWSAVVDILKAAELVGADNLPDVPAPKTDGVVMDVQYHVEQFGAAILTKARKAAERPR